METPGTRIVPYKRSAAVVVSGAPPGGVSAPGAAVIYAGEDLILGLYVQVPATNAGNNCNFGAFYGAEAFNDGGTDALTLLRLHSLPFSEGRALQIVGATFFYGAAFLGPSNAFTAVSKTGAAIISSDIFLSDGDADVLGDQVFRTGAHTFVVPAAGDSESWEYDPWDGAGVPSAGRMLLNPTGNARTRLQMTLGVVGGNLTQGYGYLQVRMREVGGG
jgi:hypothetical protein